MLKRNKMTKNRKKGQSAVEYILLVTAVIAVILVFLGSGGIFQSSLNQALNQGTTGMTTLANRLGNSWL